MTNQNRILQNFRRDVPLQGLTAKADGRLKGDIETGMVSCNRSGDKPLRPPGPALKETASTFRCGPTVRPDVPSAFPAKHGQQGMSTGRHISRVHVETTAVTISRTSGAATSREAHPSDLDQAIFNDTARRPVSARPQSPRQTPACSDPSVLSNRGWHHLTSVNYAGRSSRAGVTPFAVCQPIDRRGEGFLVLFRHLGDTMAASRVSTGSHPLVMLVVHQHEPGFPMPGEHSGLAAGGGDIANVLAQVACCKLPHCPLFC